MTWNDDDDLGGEDALSASQRAAINRYRGRQGRYQRDRTPVSTRDAWAAFDAEEARTEQQNIRRGGGR